MIIKLLLILGASLLCGFLGALGGAPVRHGKGYRRFGVPCIITLVALYNIHNILTLILLALIGVLFIGYGIPYEVKEIGELDNINHSLAGDRGSILGMFWFKIFKGNELWTNFATRGTIGLLICLVTSIVPIITGDWILYFSANILIIWFMVDFSWRDFGSIIIKGIPLAKCELYTYAYIASAILTLTL